MHNKKIDQFANRFIGASSIAFNEIGAHLLREHLIFGDLAMIVSTKGYTQDMLTVGKVPLPDSFVFAIGNGADLTMHGDKLRGTLVITAKEAEPDSYRCRWDCSGSQYDGREFLLCPGTRSEVTAHGRGRMVPSPYQLLSK